MTNFARALRQPLLGASMLFAVMLTLTGAFGTIRIVLPLRLLYWALITFTAAAFLIGGSRIPADRLKPAWLRNLAIALVAAAPTAIMAAAAAASITPAAFSMQRLLGFYFPAVILNLLLLALLRLTAKRQVVVTVAAPAPPDDTVPPQIAAKLPPRMARSRLIAVEAQDHYLRVITFDGDALIHMRFADALAALKVSDGTRAHRSWWVSRSSIDSMNFANGRGELTLVHGHIVPVSRSFAAQVKELARRPQS